MHLCVHNTVYNTVQQVDYSTSPTVCLIQSNSSTISQDHRLSLSSLRFGHQTDKVIIQERRHLRIDDALIVKILRQALNQLYLLLGTETRNRRLDDGADGSLVDRDERLVVHEREEAHDELAVHAICHASVTRNRVAEVLDIEGSLEAGSEEAAEGRDEGGEGRHG